MIEINSVLEILRWHVGIGVDEAIGDAPVDRFSLLEAPALPIQAPNPKVTRRSAVATPPPSQASDELVKAARALAAGTSDVDALRSALMSFEGCGLRKTATNLVFFNGAPSAKMMMVVGAPGAQEDTHGKPFVGPSGALLDKMLASIGVQRNDVLLSNTVFWRPPGNRTPTEQEAAICLPFIQRLIELVQPEILITLGGPASKALLGESQGVGRLRGRWFSYKSAVLENPIDATVMFSPESLLKTPNQKRAAWQDLLMIREKLNV